MKQEFKPLSWKVKNFDCNAQKIKYFDVLKYREDDIKKLKKECSTKEEFSKKMNSEFMYHYWSRAQYELIIERAEDGRVWLLPWCGCREPDNVKIDVTDCKDYDWKGFAAKYIDERYGNKSKIDVWCQLEFIWDSFVDYCWNYRHKYQRKNLGGARANEI